MLMTDFKAGVIVIGAGHAGIEAALASARMGIDTVIFTTNLDAVGNMPCNPSIGGSAKGHLVFEIDALGGEMGFAADKVTLQSRTLNLGKGAAVYIEGGDGPFFTELTLLLIALVFLLFFGLGGRSMLLSSAYLHH